MLSRTSHSNNISRRIKSIFNSSFIFTFTILSFIYISFCSRIYISKSNNISITSFFSTTTFLFRSRCINKTVFNISIYLNHTARLFFTWIYFIILNKLSSIFMIFRSNFKYSFFKSFSISFIHSFCYFRKCFSYITLLITSLCSKKSRSVTNSISRSLTINICIIGHNSIIIFTNMCYSSIIYVLNRNTFFSFLSKFRMTRFKINTRTYSSTIIRISYISFNSFTIWIFKFI